MTGTINPDGTVGPVGGIPYKVDGAKRRTPRRCSSRWASATARTTAASSSTSWTSATRRASRQGGRRHLRRPTRRSPARTLPRPRAATNVALSGERLPKIKAKVKSQLADFHGLGERLRQPRPGDPERPRIDHARPRTTSHTQAAEADRRGPPGRRVQPGARGRGVRERGGEDRPAPPGVPDAGRAAAFAEQVKASTAIDGKIEAPRRPAEGVQAEDGQRRRRTSSTPTARRSTRSASAPTRTTC